MRRELKRTLGRVLGSALCALLALGLGQGSAWAGGWDYWAYLEWSHDGARNVLSGGADAGLYQLSEDAVVEVDASGNPGAPGAQSPLPGVAKLRAGPCPS